MFVFLVVLSLIASAVGFLFLSEATTGVGIIGIAALFGIWARIAQAEEHQRVLLAALDYEEPTRREEFEKARRELAEERA